MERSIILFVDDDPVDRRHVSRGLGTRYELVEASTCAEAERQLAATRPDAAILDYRLPDGDALTLLKRLHESDPELPAVILTSHGSIDLAVEAMRRGAHHFLDKPAEPGALAEVLERCLEERRDRRRQRAYDAARDRHRPDPFRGASEAIRGLEKRARKVCAGDGPVLLLGATGSGKGVLARWLHDHGPRAAEPFVELNCAGLKPELLENELFGHEKGAFTGAGDARPGLLDVADRGTLFLDEIGDMDLSIQTKLLKVLEEQTFRRLGGVRERRVEVRLIAATAQNIQRLVRAKLFRRDLFFRVNTLPLEIPPLSRRREDIPSLAEYYLERLGRKMGRVGVELSPEALEEMRSYRWPGNIRELRNVLERAMLLAESDVLEADDLHFHHGLEIDAADSLSFSLTELERRHIQRVLEDEGGSVPRTAQRLGIPRSSLYKKIKKYGIELK